jgi:hypothetical protein
MIASVAREDMAVATGGIYTDLSFPAISDL